MSRIPARAISLALFAVAALAVPVVTASALPPAHAANFVTPKTLVTYSSLADSPEARFKLVLGVNGSGSFVSGVRSRSGDMGARSRSRSAPGAHPGWSG